MFYVYVIVEEKTDERYIGFSSDLKRRVAEHNSNRGARYTRNGNWKLVYYEAFSNEADARIRERKLKQDGRSRHQLYSRIAKSLCDHK